MADVKVTIFDDGPIKIEGPITLHDENDVEVTIEGEPGEPIFLCRCGQSSEKPYCDGTHNECGFNHKVSA